MSMGNGHGNESHPPTQNDIGSSPPFRPSPISLKANFGESDKKFGELSEKAQVSVYIIIGLILAVLIIFIFAIRSNVGDEEIPQSLRPAYDYYGECIDAETRTAVDLAGAGGGRIAIKNYVPGSEYAPFASHLNFLGSPVEYWYSIEGNGLIKENVPSLNDIEDEIAEYVKEGVKRCDFEYFYRQGFNVSLSEADVDVKILERKVEVTVDSPLVVSKGDETATKNSHYVEVESKIGKFYNLATEIYDEEKSAAFMEDYAIDVLYNYAPVSGVEIQCGPKIWKSREVMNELRNGLQENFQTIKFQGDYYSLKSDERKYFVYEKGVDEATRLLYLKDWPSRIEIYGDGVDDELMVSEPIGNEQGMGAMGFCYVPYHFIYDVQFPVMVQVYDEKELFQFPVVVVIDKNAARNAMPGEAYTNEDDFELCEFMNKEVIVNLYDINLNKVEGNVSFECFNQKCRLGETNDGSLRTAAPACVNGYVHVRASGFAEKKELFSTNEQGSIDVILDRERKINVELRAGGTENNLAIVTFTKDDGTVKTIAMPEQNETELSEGNYEIKVYVYGNSTINIPASTKSQCVDVPKAGLLGLFGGTKEQCFDITIPETKIESALIGGGVLNTYLLDSELEKGNLKIQAEVLPKPSSIEMLSKNFEDFENKRLWLEFSDER